VRRQVQKLRATDYEDSGLVFTIGKGTPLDAQNVVNRHFKPLLRREELPDKRWRDLPHSCFTLLLSRGVRPKYVQHLAGHASVQLTLDRYSHWMPTMGKHAASAMDEALDEADSGDAPSEEKDALIEETGRVGPTYTSPTRHTRCAKIGVRQRNC
jgi:integrase